MSYSTRHIDLRLLSDTKITSLPSLHTALEALHTIYGVPHVVLSSIPFPISVLSQLNVPPPPESYTRLLPETHPPWYDAIGAGEPTDEVLVCFASTYKDGKLQTYAFALPTVRGYFSGVGDLFSALVLGHYCRPDVAAKGDPLVDAVSKALLTVQQILLRTHLYSLNVAASGTATPRPLHGDDEAKIELPADSVIPSDTELDDAPPLNPSDPKRKARRMRLRELRIIPEREMIVNGGQGWPSVAIDSSSVAVA